MVSLGFDPAQAWKESLGLLRQKALKWVGGMRTPSGRDRGLAVAMCGRPIPIMFDGEVGLAGQRCRDRACPRCQALLARELAALLEAYVGDLDGEALHLVTLTQPKPHTLDPLVPIVRALDMWRALTNSKTAAGKDWHATFDGALRVLEVTWSPKGKRRRDGSLVEYSGWHAHFHCIVQGGTREAVDAMVDRWVALVDGARGAQDVQSFESRHCREVCKYVVKPLLDVPSHLGRVLFGAIHGRRLSAGVGSWYGWKAAAEKLLPDEPDAGTLLWAVHGDPTETGQRRPLPLDRVTAAYGDRYRCTEESVTFHGWSNGVEATAELPVEDLGNRLRLRPRWLSQLKKERAEKKGVEPPQHGAPPKPDDTKQTQRPTAPLRVV